MPNTCPYEKALQCSCVERTDEFYRQLMESMLQNTPIYFITGNRCPAYAANCAKLQAYLLQQKQR